LPAEDALHKEALAAAVETEVRGVKTRVMTAEHLMAIALKLGRKKDEARVERFIEVGRYDKDKLNDILRRYNLFAKWKELSDGYMRNNE
jgi:predicted nucleotidyltransferase